LDSIPTENLTFSLNNICAKELEKIRLFLNESFTIKFESLTTRYIGDQIENEDIEGNNGYLNVDGFI